MREHAESSDEEEDDEGEGESEDSEMEAGGRDRRIVRALVGSRLLRRRSMRRALLSQLVRERGRKAA